MRVYLANISQKVYAHEVLIKNLELQIAQLPTTLNPRQPVNIPSNTIKNPKIMGVTWKSLVEEVTKPLIHMYCLC